MSHVFISYGTGNRRTAEKLCASLEESGIICWMAPRDISSGNYAGEITRALKAADIVVVVCSRDSCRSEHVKNEVTLAFNNAKLLLPYCLEENAFDDDLEYFLSSKQRIMASGDSRKDFQLIERIIRDSRGETKDATPEISQGPAKSRKGGLLILVFLICALVAAILFLMRKDKSAVIDPDKQVAESMIDTIATVEEPAVMAPSTTGDKQTVKAASTPANADTFTGKITDGYPDGVGRYTFRKARRIDMHDELARMAEPGDYIEGSWTRGHLNYGEWYGADGVMKAFIQLGDNPDTEPDRQLGKCVKP